MLCCSVDEFVTAEALAHEKSGERPTVELIQKMGALNINAMVSTSLRPSPGTRADSFLTANGSWKAPCWSLAPWRIQG